MDMTVTAETQMHRAQCGTAGPVLTNVNRCGRIICRINNRSPHFTAKCHARKTLSLSSKTITIMHICSYTEIVLPFSIKVVPILILFAVIDLL